MRAIGASNYNVEQLLAALKVAKNKDLPAYQVLQPEYNLYDRAAYDGGLRELCIKLDLGVVTYYSLASGFLSGKYRSKADLGKSTRGESTAKYLDERGLNILKALDIVSARHQAKPAEIALAWLMAREASLRRSLAPPASRRWKVSLGPRISRSRRTTSRSSIRPVFEPPIGKKSIKLPEGKLSAEFSGFRLTFCLGSRLPRIRRPVPH